MAAEKSLSGVAPRVTVVGIGEDGLAGLGDAAKQAIGAADLVLGGRRHLALAAPLIRGEARAWPSPFDVSAVTPSADRSICVLASGDPFLHGVGATLAKVLEPAEMQVFPAPSAFSLAAARLGWPLADIETVSLHGRPIDLLRPLLHPGRRVLALTSDADGPAEVARMLDALGFGPSTVTVLEALGGEREQIRRAGASSFGLTGIDPLNVVAIEVVAGVDARVLPLTPGLPDHMFEHDGQITKREVRALTLAALAPCHGQHLLDIGAGAGSVSIEWMLADPSMRATAVETNADRAARIGRNAAACGVPGLAVIQDIAPAVLEGLPAPDAIFIGGGLADSGVADAAIALLRPGGRLVANTVTLESEAVLLALHARLGGKLTRIAISRAEPVGGMQGWRPAMPVTQWTWVKP